MELTDQEARTISGDRHRRLLLFTLVSLTLGLAGFYFFGFDRPRALAYAAASYTILVSLNYRAILTRAGRREFPQR